MKTKLLENARLVDGVVQTSASALIAINVLAQPGNTLLEVALGTAVLTMMGITGMLGVIKLAAGLSEVTGGPLPDDDLPDAL